MSVINLSGEQGGTRQQFQLQPNDISGVTELGQLKDVDTTGISNNSIIKYNSTSGNWEIATDSVTQTLSGLTDVTIPFGGLALADGHIIRYNASSNTFGNFAPRIDSLFLSNFSGGFSDNQFMKYNNSASAWQAVDLDISLDTSPQLGGDLDINSNKIVSTGNTNIIIDPGGTGNVTLGNYTFDGDGPMGAAQDNFVLTYDNSTGFISLEAGGGLSNVVEDTSPQLGGTLDTQGFALTHDGVNIIERTGDNNSPVVMIRKDVGTGGDLGSRTGTINLIKDNLTSKYLGLNNWQDDSTAGKKYQIGYLSDDGSTTTILQHWSENSGSTINVPLTLDHTNNSNNATDLMLKKTTTRTLSQNQPGVNLDFRTEYSGTTTPQHQIKSRRFGSEDNKQLQFFDVNDAGTGATKLVQFKKNSAWTSTNNHVEMQMNGRIDLTILNADDMPNSNITKVNMDGTTATNHNILTGKMDFGSSSITNGAQVQFVGEAFNDAGGGESSPDRIGALIFSYGTNEKDNQIELRVANHDLSTQSNLKVDGEQAGSSVPFKVPAYTVANLPTSGIDQGAMAVVTNANTSDVSTGIAHCFYNGSDWKYTHLPATTVRT